MTGCHASAAFGILLLGVLAALPGLAQDGERRGPTQLGPATQPGAPATEPAPGTTVRRGNIETTPLGDISLDATGVLDPVSGGLSEDMWGRLPRSEAVRLIIGAPDAPASPLLRDLLRRLYLSEAEVPPEDFAFPAGTLYSVRVRKLFAMGALDDALDLARAGAGRDAEAHRVLFEALLLKGEDSAACAEAEEGVRSFDEPFWQEALVYCQLSRGEIDAAVLGLDLLREQDAASSGFMALAGALVAGEVPALPDAGEGQDAAALPEPLEYALLRAGGAAYDETLPARASPPLLVALAGDDSAPPALRISAAEQAAALGALSPGELGEAYPQESFAAADVQAAAGAVPADVGPESRALLFAGLVNSRDPVARARLLAPFYDQARQDGLFVPLARLTASMVRELNPRSDLAWFAADAARVLLADGDVARARAWYDVLTGAAVGGGAATPELTLARDALRPILYVVDERSADLWDAGAFDNWLYPRPDLRAAMPPGEAPPESREHWTELLLALMQAFDRPAGERIANLARSDAAGPSRWAEEDGDVEALRAALHSGSLAQVVLLAAAVAGPAPVETAEPVRLGHAVDALRAAGFPFEAQALATEALLAIP